jgi:2-methylisocitrate lyase-like PEP mutase family enzyme
MGLKGATYSLEELAAAGVKRISVGGSFARAALGAFVRAAREVKEKGTFSFAADAIPHAEVSAYMAKGKRSSRAKRYVRSLSATESNSVADSSFQVLICSRS